MIDILDIIDSDAEVDTKVYDSFQDYIQNKAETGEVKDKSNFSIPDYNMYYNESHLNKCDGVVVYVKHSISVIESLVQLFNLLCDFNTQPIHLMHTLSTTRSRRRTSQESSHKKNDCQSNSTDEK
nr:unnamed protein product [Callosobruchus analis]